MIWHSLRASRGLYVSCRLHATLPQEVNSPEHVSRPLVLGYAMRANHRPKDSLVSHGSGTLCGSYTLRITFSLVFSITLAFFIFLTSSLTVVSIFLAFSITLIMSLSSTITICFRAPSLFEIAIFGMKAAICVTADVRTKALTCASSSFYS